MPELNSANKNKYDQIMTDKVIDAAEVTALETFLYNDGEIDQNEIMLLCRLDEDATEKHSSFHQLCEKAFHSFALEDQTSPGEIDQHEARFLIEQFDSDGIVSDMERNLTTMLITKAKSVHQSFLDWASSKNIQAVPASA
jgi:hypothetical protein